MKMNMCHLPFILAMALSIASINVRSILSHDKRRDKLAVIKNSKADIIFAQELWLQTVDDIENVKRLWSNGHSELSIGPAKADGVAIFFNVADVVIIKRREPVPGRMLVLECLIRNKKVRLINVYASQRATERTQLFNKLGEFLHGQTDVILAGDFNTITEENDRIPAITPFNIGRDGKALLTACNSSQMKDAFKSIHPTGAGFTHFNSRGKRRIDRIYVSQQMKVLSYRTEAWVISDHLAVRATVGLQLQGGKRPQNSWKLNTTCLTNMDIRNATRKEIKRVKDLRVFTNTSCELWEELKERLKRLFINECKVMNMKRNLEYDDLMKTYINLKCKAKSLLTDSEESELKEVEKRLTVFNNEYMDVAKIHAGIEVDDPVHIHKVIEKYKKRIEQKTMVALKNKEGILVNGDREIQEVVVEHFKEMYRENGALSSPETYLSGAALPRVRETGGLLGEITRGEVISAISTMSKAKAPGPDGLPAEFYQTFVNEIADLLTCAYNDGIANSQMHGSFYKGIVSLIFKKGDPNDIDNWRQITLANIDYKIFAKILMTRMGAVLDEIIEKEQTCAIKGRNMWDNLSTIREIIANEQNFFLVGLDQKRAFDFINRDYLWRVLKEFGFPQDFINMIKVLYSDSKVAVKVNGNLSEFIAVNRGLKQGCPLSAALYVVAISPLLTKIKNDSRLKGTDLYGNSIRVMAYADDVTVMLNNQKEWDIIREHFNEYEQVSGAKLNDSKTECIWVGEERRMPRLRIEIKKEIKILGIRFSGNIDECIQNNWERKEREIKEECEKWKPRIKSYKSKIQIINMFILSKLMFLASVIPPPVATLSRIVKMCVCLIWGVNMEVGKRELLYKTTINGGLGAIDVGLKVKMAYYKNVTSGIAKGAPWVGNLWQWQRRRGRTQVPYHKTFYSDFNKVINDTGLSIDWNATSKRIYSDIANHFYGKPIIYNHLTEDQSKRLNKYMNSNLFGSVIFDVMWLTINKKLQVGTLLRWSHGSDQCPMPNCDAVESIEHLIIQCERSKQVWKLLYDAGVKIDRSMDMVYANYSAPEVNHMLFWVCICVTICKIWKSRCKLIFEGTFVDGHTVFKQIKAELKRRKAFDLKLPQPKFNWTPLII